MSRTLNSFMTQKIAGQDSNDIFDLQSRFRQNEFRVDVPDYDKPKENQTLDDKAHRKLCEFEDIKLAGNANSKPTCRRSLSEGKLYRDPNTKRSPPVAVGKENVGTHFKGCLPPRVMNKKDVKSVENSDEESSGDEASSSVHSMTKSTTQEGAEFVSKHFLGDSTNVARVKDATVTQKQAEALEKMKPLRRPCIRVREPPGGKSSIVFH